MMILVLIITVYQKQHLFIKKFFCYETCSQTNNVKIGNDHALFHNT